MVIGEQHAARRHLIFGMMRLYAFLIGGDARQHLAITGRCRVGVKHDQKVVALAFLVAAPDEQVMAGLVRGLSLGGRAERRRENSEEQVSKHQASPGKLAAQPPRLQLRLTLGHDDCTGRGRPQWVESRQSS